MLGRALAPMISGTCEEAKVSEVMQEYLHYKIPEPLLRRRGSEIQRSAAMGILYKRVITVHPGNSKVTLKRRGSNPNY